MYWPPCKASSRGWGCTLPSSSRGKDLGIVLGVVAEPVGVGIVPIAARVARDAIDDLVGVVGLQPDGHEPRKVVVGLPCRQHALVHGRFGARADAHAEAADAVLQGVVLAEILAERLGESIAAVGTRRSRMVDTLCAPIEADGMIGRREQDAIDASQTRALIEIDGADQVRLDDLIPSAFDGLAAQMHDRLDAGAQPRDRRSVRQFGDDGFLARASGRHGGAVGETQQGIAALQALAQCPAQRAGRARDQDFRGFHGEPHLEKSIAAAGSSSTLA